MCTIVQKRKEDEQEEEDDVGYKPRKNTVLSHIITRNEKKKFRSESGSVEIAGFKLVLVKESGFDDVAVEESSLESVYRLSTVVLA